MVSTASLIFIVCSIALSYGALNTVSINRGCNINNKYQTLVALLDLRSGISCKDVNLHGVQQLAVIRSTINQINADFRNDNISIKLHVFDTCSTKEGTTLATLKSLVASQQTCFETPFLLGFVGPERHVNSIRPITKVFKTAHVVPYLDFQPSTSADAVLPVSSYPLHHHSQAVKNLIKGLRSKRVIVIYELNDMVKMKLNDILDSIGNDICFVASIAIEEGVSFSIADHLESDVADAVLTIVDSIWALNEIANTMTKESETLPNTIILSISKIGSIIWPSTMNQNVYILQMISGSKIDDLATEMDGSLLHEWIHQKVTDCTRGNETLTTLCTSIYSLDVASRQQDWTLLSLHYGLLLYSSAIRITKSACLKSGQCQNTKWFSTLRDASLFVKPENGSQLSQRISFGMDLPSKFLIYSVQKGGEYLQIGEIEGGKLKMNVEFQLPPTERVNYNETACTPSKTSVVITKVEVSTERGKSFEDDILNFLNNMQNAQGVHMIGLLAGCCAAVLFIFIIAFYSVYRGVHVRDESVSCNRSSVSTLSTAS